MISNETIELLVKLGYPLIFLLVFIEGPIVTITAGFLTSAGYLNIFIAYPVIVIADLAADIIWYFIGYFSRNKILNRWGHFIGLTPKRMEGFEAINAKYKNHQGKILFLAKITHVIGFPFLVAAGAFKWDIKKYILFNFLATLPKSLLFILLGYYFGEARFVISRYLGYSSLISIAALVLAIAIYFIITGISKKLFKKIES